MKSFTAFKLLLENFIYLFILFIYLFIYFYDELKYLFENMFLIS